MHHTNIHHRGPVAATILVLLLACLGLAACGSSGSTSTTTTVAANANATSPSTAPGGGTPVPPGGAASGQAGGRFAAMRACLAKEGITLPQRTPGQRPPGAGGLLGGGTGGPQLPKGVTRAQFEAALKKCGGGTGHFFRGGSRLNSPAYRQVLTAFAACMRQNGVNLPSPNSSGTGPVFNTKGVNTASAQFKAAEAKCQSILRSAFPRRPSAAGGGTGGA
jgi:hypothetical protein